MEIPVTTWTPAEEPLAYEAVYEQLRRAVMRDELPGGGRLRCMTARYRAASARLTASLQSVRP